MYIQNPTNRVVLLRSYLDVNAGYTGVNFHERGFKVNDYNPEDYDN
jgi:hypothetical protein